MDKQFDNLTWADLAIINDELKTVREHDIKLLKYMDLQTVCSQLKVRGVKNTTKDQMIRKLLTIHQAMARYNKTSEMCETVSTRKEPQCPFRLLNFLFSDPFAEGFSTLGNVAAHAKLDLEKATNNQLFWEGVQEEFQGKDPAIASLHFADDEFLLELHYDNFKKIVLHDWKKLHSMWKPLNAEYNAALVSRFQSLIPQTLEHQFKQQEEARKATEHNFKQQEEARKAREHIFHEW